jgi:hypothetical protein
VASIIHRALRSGLACANVMTKLALSSALSPSSSRPRSPTGSPTAATTAGHRSRRGGRAYRRCLYQLALSVGSGT